MLRKNLAVMLGAFALSFSLIPAQNVEHPLDPLNWQEYWKVLEVIQEAGHLDENTRFSVVNLDEPPKDSVLSWKEGQTIPRRAYALVRQEEHSYEAVVDLVKGSLVRWSKTEGIQPSWLEEELYSLVDVVKKNPDFIEAMKRRGYEDLTLINCEIIPPGYYGTEEDRGRRVGHAHCVDPRGIRNDWTRGIAGLTAVVDLNEKRVLRVVDEGVVPVPRISADYDQASIGDPRKVPGPIHVTQPQGPGFKIQGHQLEWQNWRFHIRPDQRAGKVISLVKYVEGEESRSVLYQGHLSEMFVPYMDPAFAWYPRNFLDAGEFAMGGLAKPLLKGLDCPDHALLMDSLVSNDLGRPKAVPNTICVFERSSGDMAWRHWADEPESRPKRDLVVRSAAVLGNYDYVFDWIFQQDGSIRIAVGATGIAETKMVAERTASPDANYLGTNGSDPQGGPAPDAYGRFVDPNVVAVNHDHYFSFRLDLDVDGTANSLLLDRLRMQRLPDGHPRRSIWVRQPVIAKTESAAKMNINLEKPALWRVISHNRRNHVGYETSYQLMPGKTGRTLLSEDDYPRRRAGFIDYHLWATPYQLDEKYAAGDHPTLSEPGQGLPNWTSQNRAIEKTDVVLWYTVGMHHLVRAEDWPVMPVLWHTFELRPFDFFNGNPAMDLPRTP